MTRWAACPEPDRFERLLSDDVPAAERAELEAVRKDLDDQQRILEDDIFLRMERLLTGKVAAGGPQGLKAGSKITKSYLDELPRQEWFEARVRNEVERSA